MFKHVVIGKYKGYTVFVNRNQQATPPMGNLIRFLWWRFFTKEELL